MKLRALSIVGLMFVSIGVAAQAQMTSATASVSHVEASRATVWLGTQRFALGLGQRRGPTLALALPQPDHAEPTLGIGVKLTPATTLEFESDARSLRAHDAWVSDDPQRVALSFRTTSRSREAKSLLTVQLSGQSVLQLRPRASGLRAVYTVAF
jgi:hypothetical protein